MAVQLDNCNNKQNIDAQFDIKQKILIAKLNVFTPSTAGRCCPEYTPACVYSFILQKGFAIFQITANASIRAGKAHRKAIFEVLRGKTLKTFYTPPELAELGTISWGRGDIGVVLVMYLRTAEGTYFS